MDPKQFGQSISEERAHRIPPGPAGASEPEKATPLFVTPREVGRLLRIRHNQRKRK